MDPFFQKYEPDLEKIINQLKQELVTLRTDRANPLIVENILVKAYSVKTPLKQLASINVFQVRTIIIEPWDKNILKDIEKAIIEAKIGLSPVNKGKHLLLVFPQMTGEDRKSKISELNNKLEKTKIKIRTLRDKIREEIVTAERNKEITEDDKYNLQKKLDELTKDYNEKIKEIGRKKQEEIMTI